MEFIRSIRDMYNARIQSDIQKQSEYTITITDFEENLYIAYLGVPLIPIHEDWSPKIIMEELTKVRQNFINSKLQQSQ